MGCLCMSCLSNFQKNEGPRPKKMMISAPYALMEGISCAVTIVQELFTQVDIIFLGSPFNNSVSSCLRIVRYVDCFNDAYFSKDLF